MISPNEPENDKVLFFNFNQDYSCVSVGTTSGYQMYNCDPFGQCHSQGNAGTSIAEMLFSTSLVALVGVGTCPEFNSRDLHIINTKNNSSICELKFPEPVLAVKMNRRRMIVVLERQIFLYDIRNMKLLHSFETVPNPKGACALTSSPENCLIAYPAQPSVATSPLAPFGQPVSPPPTPKHNDISGDVEIFDAVNMQLIKIIPAHKSPISCLAMNADATLLATASEKGTVIRMFSLPDANKVFEFRRGSYPASIYSISFNLASTLLCVSSDTETVHIFRIPASEEDADAEETKAGMGNKLRRSSKHLGRNIGSILPHMITGMWEPLRDFASLKLPNTGVRSLVALSSTMPQVMLVTSEGYLYEYSIDLEKGGECMLLKQHSLLK
ncbi:wd40 repeat-like protein [Lichtheimia corymbifera JMRC:FSU:9682]|uniref:Wd40 repeat-like protein n=1 Tax=Lichtheimia corymbifera JMRC:FSU:9682 TaxID=1263082 RepID=A0A068RKY4_9FUNG|nr:wd40 repeat-like protein [Lichtheimia corymbifera JMRC:FSU:9682]